MNNYYNVKKIEETKLIIYIEKKIKYFTINKYKNNCSIQNKIILYSKG